VHNCASFAHELKSFITFPSFINQHYFWFGSSEKTRPHE